MPDDASGVFRLAERAGPGRRAVLRRDDGEDAELLVISGFQGPRLPAAVTNPRVAAHGAAGWRLESEGGSFDFIARAVDTVHVRPGLYRGLHRSFALGARDRLAARILLMLLRLPGGAGLLRRWHAGRSR